MSNQFDFQKCRQDQDISPQGQHNSGLLISNQVDYIPLGIARIDPFPTHLWPAIGAALFHFFAVWKRLFYFEDCRQILANYHKQHICQLLRFIILVLCKKWIPVKQGQ